MAGIAVVVIDVQQAFFSGPNASYRGAEVIDGINRLSAAARAAGAPVFIVQHDEADDPEIVYGSEGWQLPASLVRTSEDILVRKSVGDSFQETPLKAHLDRLGIDRLLICGYATEFCIDTGARRAALLGYRTTVVSDLHTTQQTSDLSPEQIVAHHNRVWAHSSMSGNRVSVRPLADILAAEFA
jgi:nicotinamidase-related amidase